jgi:hypothetical protein
MTVWEVKNMPQDRAKSFTMQVKRRGFNIFLTKKVSACTINFKTVKKVGKFWLFLIKIGRGVVVLKKSINFGV